MYFEYKNWYDTKWNLCKVPFIKGIIMRITIALFGHNNGIIEYYYVPKNKIIIDD